MKSPFFLRISYILSAISILTLVAVFCFKPIDSTDLFIYLAIAQKYFETGQWPQTDPFIYSVANSHWHILHEWGSFLLFHYSYVLGSWLGITLLKTFVIAATFIIPYGLAYALGYFTPLTILFSYLTYFISNSRFTERTSMVSDFLTTFLLAFVVWLRARPSEFVFLIPFLFLFWANLHPGFVFGLGILGIQLLVDIGKWETKEYKSWCLSFLVSCIACVLNPEGLSGALYPIKFMLGGFGKYTQVTYEYLPIYHELFRYAPFVIGFYFLLGASLVVFYLARKKNILFEFITFSAFTFFGTHGVRFLPISALAISIILLSLGMKINLLELPMERLRRSWVSFVLMALIFALSSYTIISRFEKGYVRSGINGHYFPVGAANFISKNNLDLRLFNADTFGGYLAFVWGGQRKIFDHGAVTDFTVTNDYLRGNLEPNEFKRIEKKYGINACLMARVYGTTPLDGYLDHSADWKLTYEDYASRLFVKR